MDFSRDSSLEGLLKSLSFHFLFVFEERKCDFQQKVDQNSKKKGNLKKDKRLVLDKLRKQEKLGGDEFWGVYDSIWQEGPEVKYQNTSKWIDAEEQCLGFSGLEENNSCTLRQNILCQDYSYSITSKSAGFSTLQNISLEYSSIGIFQFP